MTTPLLRVTKLSKHFSTAVGLFGKRVVRAVDEVSLEVASHRTLALVGESGCGKSTLGRSILRLIEPTSGGIEIDGVDVRSLGSEPLRRFRRHAQLVFQDPFGSLNPRLKIGDAIGEPLAVHGLTKTRADEEKRVGELLEQVGLDASAARRYPHEFSGGQRQRIGIARALATEPKLVIADEPVSALDVSVQAQIVNLLVDLQKARGLTYVFISHDLKVVRHLADEVAVMYLGRVVEQAPADTLFAQPLHPYTELLLSSVLLPEVGDKSKPLPPLRGEPPSPAAPPSGCHFHPRCDRYEAAGRPAVCHTEVPLLIGRGPGRKVACHLATSVES